MSDQNTKKSDPPLWLGIVVIAIGLMPLILGGKPAPGIPEWMVPMACSVFVLGGLCMVGAAAGFPWISNIIGPLIILEFAVMFIWVGFAPGERECSSSTSFLFFSKTESGSCRMFGYSGIFTAVIFIFAAVSSIKRWIKRHR